MGMKTKYTFLIMNHNQRHPWRTRLRFFLSKPQFRKEHQWLGSLQRVPLWTWHAFSESDADCTHDNRICVFPFSDFAILLVWEWDREESGGGVSRTKSGQSDFSDEIRRGGRQAPNSKDQVILFKWGAGVTLSGVTDDLWPMSLETSGCWAHSSAYLFHCLSSPHFQVLLAQSMVRYLSSTHLMQVTGPDILEK